MFNLDPCVHFQFRQGGIFGKFYTEIGFGNGFFYIVSTNRHTFFFFIRYRAVYRRPVDSVVAGCIDFDRSGSRCGIFQIHCESFQFNRCIQTEIEGSFSAPCHIIGTCLIILQFRQDICNRCIFFAGCTVVIHFRHVAKGFCTVFVFSIGNSDCCSHFKVLVKYGCRSFYILCSDCRCQIFWNIPLYRKFCCQDCSVCKNCRSGCRKADFCIFSDCCGIIQDTCCLADRADIDRDTHIQICYRTGYRICFFFSGKCIPGYFLCLGSIVRIMDLYFGWENWFRSLFYIIILCDLIAYNGLFSGYSAAVCNCGNDSLCCSVSV